MNISIKQAKEIAHYIHKEIGNYIAAHNDEYIAFCEQEKLQSDHGCHDIKQNK